MNMRVINTKLNGVVIIEPNIIRDDRGFFSKATTGAHFLEWHNT